MTSMINPTQLARQLAAEFAQRADAADRAGKLPSEDVQALRDSGYLTISVPREYGGAGLSLGECVEAQLELAQGSGSTAMVAAMQIHAFGNARETDAWPAPYLERLSCLAVEEGALVNGIASEPVMGSPSRGGRFHTYAEPHDQGWRINGHKNWSTGGTHLTHMLVSMSVDEETGLMIVPNNIDGVGWVETWGDSLSLRASDSHDVYFKDVIVPQDNLIPRAKSDKRMPNAWFPMMMAATYLGVALAARAAIIRYALDRVPTALGRPIATLPKIQRQIGEIDLELQAARLLLLDTAHQWEGDPAFYPRIVAAKHLASETAIRATDHVLRVAGGNAISHSLPFERFFRDVRGGIAHPPSGDTALEIIGKAAIEQTTPLSS
ncbi:MAG: acyl-CoA/acyl-ACP dehydrogenase [Anaerolineae bacterium]|nr:acyl-CoA/acyl-ACP dehydrogenase [Anaerolineae bacterium]